MRDAPWLAATERFVSSCERQARKTAEILARGRPVTAREAMGENERSATGFLPPEAFERMADRFFAAPEDSASGWERAVDAQARIVSAADEALRQHSGRIVLCGHGAVGTLLRCRLAGLAIARRHDQPAGGGNAYAFRRTGEVLTPWTPIEETRSWHWTR